MLAEIRRLRAKNGGNTEFRHHIYVLLPVCAGEIFAQQSLRKQPGLKQVFRATTVIRQGEQEERGEEGPARCLS